ncbi:MAG: sigma-70 family RNA polymerase sigma factor, partial [Burkholderiales bacterium]|nr:sigma-70 family RNA polymerase sigma factor [Opitutaceae bacterium]
QRVRSLEPLGEPTETAHGFASVALGEKARAVRQVLAELQTTEREAIELAFFQGLTQEEIASLTGVPVGTIKARIRRGMLKLKKPLQSLRGESLR